MEFATLGIALISLLASAWTAWKSGIFQRHELLLARRLELHALLQEADKLLLEHPALQRAFKSSESYLEVEQWSAEDRDLFDAYCVVYLNVFEAAHSVFAETSRIDKNERAVRAAWERSLTQFFSDAPASRSAWLKFGPTYYDGFREFVNAALERTANLDGPNVAQPETTTRIAAV
jgi:hypothetical protein